MTTPRKELLGDGCEVWFGDCREVLPLIGKVDAVVTDPPYGLAEKWAGGGGGKKSSWAFDPSEAMQWDTERPEYVTGLPNIAKECIIWGGNYFTLPISRCWLVWDKRQPDTWTTGQCELAWTNIDRPIRAFRFAQCEQANEGPKYHPTQKPLSLMLWCLKWLSSQIVLDPFMGSGTTGVACINLGRSFIGIEREERYYDIARRRLSDALSRPRLPLEEPRQKEGQRNMFEEAAQ